MKYPKIGISIVTYNSEKYIAKCLTSLLKNKYPNTIFVVIDNNSKDKTCKIIKREFKSIYLTQNKKNLGFAAGHNQSIRYFLKQKTDYILLFNPDAVATSNLLDELLSVFSKNKTVGAAGPIITYMSNPQKIWYAGGYFNDLFCFTMHPHMNKLLKQTNIKNGQTDFVTGACMMISSKALKKIGLLPEEYFLYFEDVSFCLSLYKNGYISYLLAKPLAEHTVSASSGTAGSNNLSKIRAYYFARNNLIYIKRSTKGLNKITSYFGQFFIRFPFYFLQMVLLKNTTSLLSYIRGLRDGTSS